MIVDLAESRAKIDEIDRQITKLFEERMEVANDVAAYKRSTGKKVYDPERENEKIRTLRGLAGNAFNETAVEDLFRQIMSISRKYQYQMLGTNANEIPFQQVAALDLDKDTPIVYFGEKSAFSEQAMLECFGENITSSNKKTFREVMQAVADGEAEYGVLPIENTSTGGISDIYDLLIEYDISIVAEHVVKVEQALLGKPGADLNKIRKVYSHPQGLMQCSKFLEEHPQMEGEEYASTASAARKVAQEDDMTQAAIASVRAAKEFGLEVLKESINYQSQNFTRFIVISNQKIFLADANKISLVFELKHEAGTLYNMLANFYYNDLNLTKIESRPIEGRSWEYRFFVDVEGNLMDSGVRNALATIQEFASKLQILGCFATK